MGESLDPTYPLFPTFAFLGLVLSLLPLSWHIQAWNSGICAFMIWTAASCLVGFVNSIVWSGNLGNPAPVWCDISSKIIIGVSVGIPASILCITRRLYYLTSGNANSMTYEDKRRMVLVDICIAAGIPVLIMILHYVVQGHRFDIIEDIGCYPVIYNTLPAYFIYFMWPILLGIISFCYSAMTLRSFWVRRLQFSQLISSNTSMSVSRYLRLVMFAIIDIMCNTPLGVFTIYIGNLGVKLAPWVSWEDTHYNFSYVGRVPSIIWRADPAFRTSVELTRWLPVLCAFWFFVLFGFASEARKHYRKIFQAVLKVLGVRPEKPIVKGLATWNKSSKISIASTKASISSFPTITAGRTLDSALELGTWKSLDSTFESQVSPIPTYYESTIVTGKSLSGSCSPTSSTHPTLIGQLIDPKRDDKDQARHRDTSQALPNIDESDVFTIDSFSYYEGSDIRDTSPLSYPSAVLPSRLSSSTTRKSLSTTSSTPPHPPSPRLAFPQYSLPPPPVRRQPRAIGSLSSLLRLGASADEVDERGRFSRGDFSFHHSQSNSHHGQAYTRSPLQNETYPDTLPSLPVRSVGDLVQDVPEDVGPSSYIQSLGGLGSLSESEEFDSSCVPLRRKNVLGVEGGVIKVVVERSASVEGSVV